VALPKRFGRRKVCGAGQNYVFKHGRQGKLEYGHTVSIYNIGCPFFLFHPSFHHSFNNMVEDERGVCACEVQSVQQGTYACVKSLGT